MEYKIFKMEGLWNVYSGHTSYGAFVKKDIVFYSSNIADCYCWIKAKEENLIGL